MISRPYGSFAANIADVKQSGIYELYELQVADDELPNIKSINTRLGIGLTRYRQDELVASVEEPPECQ